MLPQPFTNQENWGISTGYSQNLLESGAWRMPYLNELKGITTNCGNGPTVNRTVFPDVPDNATVWSGSPKTVVYSDSLRAWTVNFYFGAAYYYHRNDNAYPLLVRLVRAGQPFAALSSPAAQAVAAGTRVAFPAVTLGASTG